MASNVVAFRDRSLPLKGRERLKAIRIYRATCREIAARTVAQMLRDSTKALRESTKAPGSGGDLDYKEALVLFAAAMRRELRKYGPF